MPPQRPSLRVQTIPLVTGFCQSGLKYTCSWHGKLSTIIGTNKSANKTTVITVASFYCLNFVWLQYSGLKCCFFFFLQCTQSARIIRVQLKQIEHQTADQNVSCARNLRLALKHSPRLFLPHLHQNKARKGSKVQCLGNFYTKKSKCFDLDGYRGKIV